MTLLTVLFRKVRHMKKLVVPLTLAIAFAFLLVNQGFAQRGGC